MVGRIGGGDGTVTDRRTDWWSQISFRIAIVCLYKIWLVWWLLWRKTYGCYGANMLKMRRKNWFDTRFELFGSEIGRNSGKINSSADLPHLPSPPGSAQIRAGRVVEKSFKILPWRSGTTWFLLPGPSITIKYHLTGLALTTAMETHKMRTDLIILVLRFVNTRLAEFCKKKKKKESVWLMILLTILILIIEMWGFSGFFRVFFCWGQI